ncbi:hypothetical protein C8A03DRAFT_15370 [Achaetomium macrosporum]|uniref:DUF6604 domain-containing protein n=1 Tax=Achaetomium macrosporum TaxID=79813 RepID=A0AAN7HC80_9PEZI|nr:hypothetical protein C8A03DRAFT_15370 [Achaetomium macrosporum]
MATRNLYLAYKRDTSQLLYWVIRTSNGIIKASKALPDLQDGDTAVNTTGHITVAGLVALCKLIARHISSVPPTILRLFSSVIKARTTVYNVFQQVVAENPDPETEKNNACHKHFIDALTEAFHILGGKNWKGDEFKNSNAADADAFIKVKDDLDRLVLENKFGALDLGRGGSVDDEAGESNDDGDADEKPQPDSSSAPRKRQQAKPGRGKGKRGKKPKKQQRPVTPKEQSLDDVPLESYRIIQDTDGIITDYLMAVYGIIREWLDLRAYLQGIWHECAYDGLNSAVCGTLSNLAVAMIQRTASTIFVDFPGHDNYETVMSTITRGNPEKAQGMFTIGLWRVGPSGESVDKVKETNVDVKEQFMIYTYQDLVDFVEDFQKNRSGKPTKRMSDELRNWDPNFNLQRATNEQRIRWRRSYTINWLYDLVNVFSAIVVQRNTMQGESHILEKVDWSPQGPWARHRRLFGLNEFAGFVTSLAMQKPGTDIRKRILPHHVFQLQCIVDSFMVARGWSISALKGHILADPARKFRPRRDVDLFLDRNNERFGTGFLQGVHILNQLLQRNGLLHHDPHRHQNLYLILESFRDDFRDWLGETKYMYGLKTIPPSRFSHCNPNGLWEYSPFLCGIGLAEALELAYLVGMKVWEELPEPMLLVHLHNMLVKKGYIRNPIGLYATLEELFGPAFFDGKPPTSHFDQALLERIRGRGRLATRRAAEGRREAATSHDVYRMLDVKLNRFFKMKSHLLLYRQSNWNVVAIPDADISLKSPLWMVRLATKVVVDPITGQRRLEDTDLVRRARAAGISDKDMLEMPPFHAVASPWQPPEALGAVLPELYGSLNLPSEFRPAAMPHAGGPRGNPNQQQLDGRNLLDVLKLDLIRDVCGEAPVSSLNYVFTTCLFMMLFGRFEDELKKRRNRLYIRAYETDSEWSLQKPAGLTLMALAGQDEECLRVMTDIFQNPRAGFMNHIYWKDLETTADWARRFLEKVEDDDVGTDACSVM